MRQSPQRLKTPPVSKLSFFTVLSKNILANSMVPGNVLIHTENLLCVCIVHMRGPWKEFEGCSGFPLGPVTSATRLVFSE